MAASPITDADRERMRELHAQARLRCPEFGGGPEARMIVLADGRSKVRWLLRRSTRRTA